MDEGDIPLMRVTSKQIAEICGVTRGTVDRALNNRAEINPETKAHILKVANELGYRPHFLAQSLVKKKTKTLGIVLFDVRNQIFAQLFSAFEARSLEKGYFVYLVMSHHRKELELEYINSLLDRKVDGIALLPINQGAEFEKKLLKAGVPIVTFGNRLSGQFPHVWLNDREAVRQAATYLITQGYTRLIYVSPPLNRKDNENIYVPEQRYAGLLEACEQHAEIQYDIVTAHDYFPLIEQLLEKGRQAEERCVILTSSDMYALRILKWLKEKQIRVPDEVGLMGFDNIDVLNYVNPALSTVDYSIDEIGTQLADQLIRMVQGEEVPAETFIDHEIIPGKSV